MAEMKPVLIAAAVLGVSACTVWFDFEADGRPCTPDKQCLSGYACLNGRCLSAYSRGAGKDCSQNANCALPLVCADFQCAQPCTTVLEDSECPSNQLCMVSSNQFESLVLACLEVPLCEPDSMESPGCNEDDSICFAASKASYCVPGCSVACDAEGACEGVCSDGATCQYVSGSFICLPEGVVQVGEPCDLASNFCSPGTFCLLSEPTSEGVCHRYCVVEAPICLPQPDGEPGQCNGFLEGSHEEIGYCAPS